MIGSDLENAHPQRIDNVKVFDLWNEAVLYSLTQDMAFSLNSSAKAIWELCDGSRSVGEICQELEQQFDCSESELRSDVNTTVSSLHQHGLLELRDASKGKGKNAD